LGDKATGNSLSLLNKKKLNIPPRIYKKIIIIIKKKTMGLVDSILGALPVVGQVYNAVSQSNNNSKQIEWARESMNTQRQWALEDYEKTSPTNQMARYKAAGLNPNLVYGNPQASQPVRASPAPIPNTQAPQVNTGAITGAIMEIFNLQKMQAETDKIKAQVDLVKAQTYTQDATFQKLDYANDIFRDTWGSQMSYQQEHAKNEAKKGLKLDADISFTNDQNLRNAAMTENTLAMAAEKVLTMRMEREKTFIGKQLIQEQINNIKKDETIKDYEIKLNKEGITKGSPFYIQMLRQIIQRAAQ